METKEKTRTKKLPYVKAIKLEPNPNTGVMLPTDVVRAFDRVMWEKMLKANVKGFNWKYVEHLPCRPGDDDVLDPVQTGGKEMSTYKETSTNKKTV